MDSENAGKTPKKNAGNKEKIARKMEQLVQSNHQIVFMPLDPNKITGLRVLSRMKPP